MNCSTLHFTLYPCVAFFYPEPDISMRNKKISVIKGEVVSPINPKPGCRFAPRCENCMEICTQCSPELKEVAPGHLVACHKYA